VAALALAALVAPGPAVAFGPAASFGSEGEAAGQLSAPAGIAVAPSGSVFVADSGNNRVSVFGPGGEFLYAFGRGVAPGGADLCTAATGCGRGASGGAAATLEGPEGIAISAAGNVYVSEPVNDRVSVFSAAGAFLFAFGYGVNPLGGASAEERDRCTAATGCRAGGNERAVTPEGVFSPIGPEGALGAPSGIAIDASGRVFVAENGNNRVSAFGPLGEFRRTFGWEVEGREPYASVCTVDCETGFPGIESGRVNGPAGIAILPSGDLAIAESGNQRLAELELEGHRIDVFTPEGEFVRSFGHGVNPSGGDVCTAETNCQAGSGEVAGSLAQPQSLSAGPGGSIYVGDAALERVSQFDAAGAFVRAFGAGVVDGADAFQVCTLASGCRTGHQSAIPGATSQPFGVAEACRGGLFVAESTAGVSRVERFGEADAFTPPCPTAPPAPILARLVPSNYFALGRLRRNRHRGTAALAVAVPAAGHLALAGKGIRAAGADAAAPGVLTLPLKLVGKAHRRLFQTGRRTVSAQVTFNPAGGTPRAESRRLVLTKKLSAPKKSRR
jgi:DNA-binding beta-propeller fold protein YncE